MDLIQLKIFSDESPSKSLWHENTVEDALGHGMIDGWHTTDILSSPFGFGRQTDEYEVSPSNMHSLYLPFVEVLSCNLIGNDEEQDAFFEIT